MAGSGNIPGALAPTDSGAVGGAVTFSGTGGVYIHVNKSLAQSNDVVAVSGSLANSGTGTVTVTNLGPALVVSDLFVFFPSQAVVF